MVLILRLASLLFAVLLIVVISSLLASSHTIHGSTKDQIEPTRSKLELITSSNFTQTKNHQKRQSYYNQGNKGMSLSGHKKPFRDTKSHYNDENERDTFSSNNENDMRQQSLKQPVYESVDNEQNASSYPIYRSRYHGGDGGPFGHNIPGFMGFPDMGYGFGGPGGVTNAHGFGHGPINPMAGGGGHAVGHSISILDPLFLIVTLSFVLFLIHAVLGLVDRARLPVVRARMDGGAADNEMLDQMVYELREAIKTHGEKTLSNNGVKKVQGGQKYNDNN